jgi:hypothetical protein
MLPELGMGQAHSGVSNMTAINYYHVGNDCSVQITLLLWLDSIFF